MRIRLAWRVPSSHRICSWIERENRFNVCMIVAAVVATSFSKPKYTTGIFQMSRSRQSIDRDAFFVSDTIRALISQPPRSIHHSISLALFCFGHPTPIVIGHCIALYCITYHQHSHHNSARFVNYAQISFWLFWGVESSRAILRGLSSSRRFRRRLRKFVQGGSRDR